MQQPPFLLFPLLTLHGRRFSEPRFPIWSWGTSQLHLFFYLKHSQQFSSLLPSMTSLTKENMKSTVNWKLCDLLFYLQKQVLTVPVSEIFQGWISVPKICICIVLVYAQHLPLILNYNYCGILKCSGWSFRRVKLIFQAAPDEEFVTIHIQQNMYNIGFALLKYNFEVITKQYEMQY